ncbi:hypothetical protein GCM10007984_02090 [Shewanella putrefaciens]|nr:hypothetical protein GCM10007984_02090 [Shewanella putrefaciens]
MTTFRKLPIVAAKIKLKVTKSQGLCSKDWPNKVINSVILLLMRSYKKYEKSKTLCLRNTEFTDNGTLRLL